MAEDTETLDTSTAAECETTTGEIITMASRRIEVEVGGKSTEGMVIAWTTAEEDSSSRAEVEVEAGTERENQGMTETMAIAETIAIEITATGPGAEGTKSGGGEETDPPMRAEIRFEITMKAFTSPPQ